MFKDIMKSFYAVAKGRTVGIFNTWSECEAQVKNYAGPKYRKFASKEEAEAFIVDQSSVG
jgi:ribonuclease HI